MSIAKPFTFVANTFAKASEVNANFDTVYSQVNSNISAISQNTTDIENLENNKADINGSSSQRFAVADAITDSDAINKRSLIDSTANTIGYIYGFTITKDSGSPNDTIIVSSGSCYDSTYTVMLNKTNSSTKTNSSQAANATYYVHVIGNSTGSQIDILISSDSEEPSLPSGYTLYRRIGSYYTNSSGNIEAVYSRTNSVSLDIWTEAYPSNSYKTLSWTNNTDYVAPRNGWFVASGTFNEGGFGMYVKSTGLGNSTMNNAGANHTGIVSIPAARGQTIRTYIAYGSTNITYFRFVYARGDD